MGNRLQRQENWEANERGGDYRIKYRSWRQGEPEGGPFNTPTTSSGSERARTVSNAPRPVLSREFNQFLEPSQLEGWIPKVPPTSNVSRSNSAVAALTDSSASTPLKPKSTPLTDGLFFPPEVSNSGNGEKVHRAPSVNEMILDELARAVTDELIGPEYTPVTKATSPKAEKIEDTGRSNSFKSNGGAGTIAPNNTPAEETAKKEDVRVKMVINHLYAPVLSKVNEHLQGLPEWYTAKTPPQEVAQHIRTLLEARRYGTNQVAVSVMPQYDAAHHVVPGLFVVVVCAKDRRHLLDSITRCVSTRASISEATVITTGDGFALDRFVLSLRPDDEDKSAFDDLDLFGNNLRQDIEDILLSTPESPSLGPMGTPNNIKGSSKRKIHLNPSAPASIPETAQSTGRFEIPFQEIRLMRVLGEGRTGKTWLADWNGQRVAAKVMSIEDAAETPTTKKLKSNLDEFRRELHLVSKLSHPNIVRFVGASARPPRYILLFELCEGGDLGNLIRQKDRKYSFFQIALDIANGLAFLHRNDIIHRDVKPENLMLDKSERAKVADFGLSCYASGAAAEFTAETGTYRYMAPEVMRHEHYSFPADVYSFGLVCYVLLTRRLPFDDCTPLQAAMGVARHDARPKLPANIPKRLHDLITNCWHREAQRRVDFETVVEELLEIRGQLNNRMKKLFDWGFHDTKKKKSSSPFMAMTSLATAAI